MTNFKANTQYMDFEGTAAADCHQGLSDLEARLEQLGLMTEKEFLLGVDFSYIEGSIFVQFYVYAGQLPAIEQIPTLHDRFASDKSPIPVRIVSLDLTLDEFFQLFKRFNVVLTVNGLGISGKDYKDVGSVS